MTTTLTTPQQQAAPSRGRGRSPVRKPVKRRRNWLGGLAGWLWLAVVVIPVYWVLITSFKLESNYYASNPLLPPSDPVLDNYRFVLESGFVGYFTNSVLVTAGAVVPAVLVSFMAAYAIVRGWRLRFLRVVNGMFLMGLAIPLQATVIPLYLIMIRLGLFDSLLALVLPSIAFAIPLSVLVLANFIRDVPKELFEAMRIDGATEWMTMWRLAAPLTRPAIVTVTVYNALNIWNGFLLPLILTNSPERQTLPLALSTFQGQYSVNVPAIVAAVVLTTLPILVLYVFGRRQLLTGLAAGFGGSR
jgi:raffinose/stachyose/melibiose transport system permease protein